MPFQAPDGPPVTPEQMRRALEGNPMTKEVITKIFEDGVMILFTRFTVFQASVTNAYRNGKVISNFWVIRVNPTRAKTREEKEISILHELTHLHLWRVLGFAPSSDFVSLLDTLQSRPERRLTEEVIEEFAQRVFDAKVITLEELLELGKAIVDTRKETFDKTRFVDASSNMQLINL